MLEFSRDLEYLTSLDQLCAGLMVGKSHSVLHTLQMDIQYPGIVTRSSVWARFPTDGDTFDDSRMGGKYVCVVCRGCCHV